MKIDSQLKAEFKKYITDQLALVGEKPVVKVSAPYELNTEDVESLQKKFAMLRKARIITEVDPGILAGVVIYYGSKMIDLSLRSKLHTLQQTLYESA